MKSVKYMVCLMSTYVFVMTSVAQPAGNSGKAQLLTKQMKSEIVGTFTRELKRNYIFPEIAAKLEVQLSRKVQNSDYDRISDPQQFADTLNVAIRNIASDNHLGIKYKPGANKPALKPAGTDVKQGQPVSWKVMADDIGYARIDLFDEPDVFRGQIDEAFKALYETKALIIDLRKCRGGAPASENYMISHFF